MVIRIKDPDGPNIWLPLPTGLICNRLTAAIAARAASEQGVPLTGQQICRLFAEIRRCKRSHPDWVMVEVQSADGEYVKIKL